MFVSLSVLSKCWTYKIHISYIKTLEWYTLIAVYISTYNKEKLIIKRVLMGFRQ